MAKDFQIAILLDFYGDMLTDKQRDLIDLYYNEDLSLGEIAQHQGITRQGVRDSIKRGEEFLYELEQKLGLLKKHRELEQSFEKILKLSKEIFEISDTYKYSVHVIENSKEICRIAKEHLDFE